MQEYRFNTKLFCQQRLPWLVVLLLPSLVVDGVLLYRLLTMEGLARTPQGQWQWSEVLGLYATVFVLLQAAPLLWFGLLYFYRRQGFVTVGPGVVSFYRRSLVYAEFDYGFPDFVQYFIRRVDRVRPTWGGGLRVGGKIEAVYYWRDGTSEHSRRPQKWVRIPGYYLAVPELTAQLEASLPSPRQD